MGGRYLRELNDQWTLILRADIGGFGVGSEFVWNVSGLVDYQPWKHISIIGGYRALGECLLVEIFFRNAVDLGCGTGLSGLEFLKITVRLSGVDLSPLMVDKARQKNIYDELHVLDIRKFLMETRELYDLFIAIDVFVYLGDLRDIFHAVRKRALSGAIFLFSTESCEDGRYSLQETGSYAHNRHYIGALAKGNNFELVRCEETRISKEGGNGSWGIFLYCG